MEHRRDRTQPCPAQSLERNAQLGFADHAERRGVHDELRGAHRISPACPSRRRQPAAEILPELLGSRAGPVADEDLGCAGLDKRRDDGARGAAGPENQCRAGIRTPCRRALAQVGEKAVTVGVVGVDGAVILERQGIRRADHAGPVGHVIGDFERAFLVRDRDVGPDETHPGHHPHDIREIRRRDFHRDIVPPDTMRPQPVTVKQRRPGMCDRIAYDTGKGNGKRGSVMRATRLSGQDNRSARGAGAREW